MPKYLRLYNTFTKVLDDVKINGTLIGNQIDACNSIRGSLYICGPTVYAPSHLGHAITYIRADLFRRIMKSVFNVKLTTVMNITDVDDKILAKAEDNNPQTRECTTTDPMKHPFNDISEKYRRSFFDDMQYIRVMPPDLSIDVSKNVHLVGRYIRRLEQKGHVYIVPTGDIYFDTQSVKNYVGRTRDDVGNRINPDPHKKDPRDFVLWKAAKPGEPVWEYCSSLSVRKILGRPGWHVQCSAIASEIFGNKLDFHFGGADLIFPHHYNEEACCCAYHGLDTTKSLHVWSNHWLHSGHLVLRDEKMSKSLGNVVDIRSFISESSVNALRLLCLTTHYRSNVDFNSSLLAQVKALDHKFSAFVNYLNDSLGQIRHGCMDYSADGIEKLSIHDLLEQTNGDILDGICDEFELNRGLDAILNLAKVIYNRGSGQIQANDLVAAWQLLVDWCKMCGLEYGPITSDKNENLFEILRDFRRQVRTLVLHEMKHQKILPQVEGNKAELLKSILEECDNVRARLDERGFVERDDTIK